MKHARRDYDRFQEPGQILEKLEEIEKLFSPSTSNPNWIVDDRNKGVQLLDKLIETIRDSMPCVFDPIGNDELVFLMREKDVLFPEMVLEYAKRAKEAGCDLIASNAEAHGLLAQNRRRAGDIEIKKPDMEPEDSVYTAEEPKP